MSSTSSHPGSVPGNPNHPDHIAAVRQQVARQGWALIRDAGFTDGQSVDSARVLDIACSYGRPSSRDGGMAVWAVRPMTAARDATFSMRDGEAGMHTDAAYQDRPEPLFALFGVRPAADGGLTRLLRAQDACEGLDPACAPLLSRPVWRWIRPREFVGAQGRAHRVIEAGGGIRWRRDNLLVPARLVPTADAFDAHVERHPRLSEFLLPTDSVLICDNRAVLHGRTAFTDPGRHLLRVRLTRR